MKSLSLFIITTFIFFNALAQQTMTARPAVDAKKVAKAIKIDGKLDETAWKEASLINNFTEFQPTPFKPENKDNRTEVRIMYNNDGIYVGGKCYEKSADSISRELIGRDGFGNNDWIGFSLDTYNDKQNGFEYFVTPLSEQFDAKISRSNNNNEDFSWNAVWESKSIIENDGWSFEVFIPFSAIRFGKGKEQKWGLNVFRRRNKTAQQYSWASINPLINGGITQEGFWNGITDIKPPIRLQFSPYLSSNTTIFSKTKPGEKQVVQQINGGMDVKYGINQAFTLDMALVPDFGQVQTDNRVLNLSPFRQQFNEQRPFFTEGTELFSKGDLFYSRRIGKEPNQVYGIYDDVSNDETITKDPQETKIVNATKVSGRMQNGLAVGVLNAVTISQDATIKNDITNAERKLETYPLTNYNVLVLDKTMKNNSSVSFVNTNVLRNGSSYDANVSMALIDLNDKTNTWNVGAKAGVSYLNGNGITLNDGSTTKEKTGYTQSIYFGKTSGKLNFNVYCDYTNATFDKNDLGYQQNNNIFETGYYIGYNINKPKAWYNRIGGNINSFNTRLASPIDLLKQNGHMYQEFFTALNFFGQTKKLWNFYANFNYRPEGNDYYEPRKYGRVFKRASRVNLYMNINSNDAKKYSFSPELGIGTSTQFENSNRINIGLSQKIRLNQKFSIEHYIGYEKNNNQAGFATNQSAIYFAKRDVTTVQNRISAKYNFTNKMGITFTARHYWSGVNPSEIFLLNTQGYLDKPVNSPQPVEYFARNFNQFAINMVYTWQINNGSFLYIVWKDDASDYAGGTFEKNYFKNFDRTFSENNATTFSVKLIYFLDYLKLKKRA